MVALVPTTGVTATTILGNPSKNRIQSNLSRERTWDRSKLIRELGSQMEFQNKDQCRVQTRRSIGMTMQQQKL
jgi:hypothetical protein